MNTEPSINEILAHHGYTTTPGPGLYTKRILRDGVELLCGRAGDVVEWLRKRGELHVGGASCD